MNTAFVIENGQVEETEPTTYWNYIRNTVQAAQDELTSGEPVNTDQLNEYLDEAWRPNLTGYNYETGETEEIEVTDGQWNEYKRCIINELERIASPF